MTTTHNDGYRVIAVHGYNSWPEKHWFPWLSEQLESRGIPIQVCSLPDSSQPQPQAWQQALREQIPSLDEKTIVVAHSLGCITVLRYLLEKNFTPHSLILVSGFLAQSTILPELNEFIGNDVTPARLKEKGIVNIPSIVIYSDNDEVVLPEHSKELAEALSSEHVFIPQGQHFLEEEGWTEFPQLLEIITSTIPQPEK